MRRLLQRLTAHPHLKKLMHGAHATFLRLTTTGITLLFGIVATQLLGAELFGSYVSLIAIAGLLATACSIGIPTLLARELAAARGTRNWRNLAPINTVSFAVIAVLALAVLGTALMADLSLTLLSLFVFFGVMLTFLTAVYNGFERVLAAAWIGGVMRPVTALLSLPLLYYLLSPGVLVPMGAQVMGAFLAFLMLLIVWKIFDIGGNDYRELKVGGLMSRRWQPDFAALAKSGVVLGATQVLVNLSTQIDILILTALRSPQEVAYYYAAARAALVVSFFYTAGAMLSEPTLTRLLGAGKKKEAAGELQRTALTGFSVTLIAALTAIAFGNFYLQLYSPDFLVAAPVLWALVSGIAVTSAIGPAQIVLRATRNERYILVSIALGVACNALLSFPLTYLYGIDGAAAATVTGNLVFAFSMHRFARVHGNLRSDVLEAWTKR